MRTSDHDDTLRSPQVEESIERLRRERQAVWVLRACSAEWEAAAQKVEGENRRTT
jgi:hypothetical protein